jgi:Raf kinase inhibitor-like YbhB/YbcL family protein
MIGSIALLGLMLAAVVASTADAEAARFVLTSTDFAEGEHLALQQAFNGFGSPGGNLSPALNWSGAPVATRGFALTVFDPDAPGGGFWHWLAIDMPPRTAALAKGAGDARGRGMPAGSVQARNDFGQAGYGGPCPPPGRPHRYRFTLFALDVDRLPVAANATPAAIAEALRAHALAETTLTGLYAR